MNSMVPNKVRNIFSNLDYSNIAVIIGNLFVLCLALTLNFEFSVLVWGFWAESLIIGGFTFLKFILIVQNNAKNKASRKIGGIVAISFAVHYGLFHYAFFVLAKKIGELNYFGLKNFFEISSGATYLPVIIAIFFVVHGFSFFENSWKKIMRGEDLSNELKDSFFGPYKRIAPIYITILLLGTLFLTSNAYPKVEEYKTYLFIAILLLKTFWDLVAHVEKNKLT